MPQGDPASWVWKARTKVARRLTSRSPRQFEGDDFDWRRYHLEYAAQLEEIEKSHTLRLETGQWDLRDARITLNRGLPLHGNHKVLYETILALEPESILEAGCGGGDHLHNLSLLMPNVSISGVDRSEGQLETLRSRNPSMAKHSGVVDLTLPHPTNLPKSDLVFAQAVLMHIQTGNGHRVALWNLFDLANCHVVLMENIERHELLSDIQTLWQKKILPWTQLHLYKSRDSSEPPVIVASRSPISIGLREIDLSER